MPSLLLSLLLLLLSIDNVFIICSFCCCFFFIFVYKERLTIFFIILKDYIHLVHCHHCWILYHQMCSIINLVHVITSASLQNKIPPEHCFLVFETLMLVWRFVVDIIYCTRKNRHYTLYQKESIMHSLVGAMSLYSGISRKDEMRELDVKMLGGIKQNMCLLKTDAWWNIKCGYAPDTSKYNCCLTTSGLLPGQVKFLPSLPHKLAALSALLLASWKVSQNLTAWKSSIKCLELWWTERYQGPANFLCKICTRERQSL